MQAQQSRLCEDCRSTDTTTGSLTGNGGARQTLKLKIPSHAFARSPRRPVRPLLLRTALFFLCVGPVLAQGETQRATQDATTQDATQGEYQGPSVLSRGSLSTIGGQISQFGFRPFAGVGGIYDSGLTFTSVDSSGKPTNIDDYGVQVQVGANAHRSWGKPPWVWITEGISGTTSAQAYFDGSDNMFALGLNRQLGRRWNLSLREAAGTFTRAFGSLTGYGFYDPNQIVTPVNEFSTIELPTPALLATSLIRRARGCRSMPGQTAFWCGATPRVCWMSTALRRAETWCTAITGMVPLERTTGSCTWTTPMRLALPTFTQSESIILCVSPDGGRSLYTSACPRGNGRADAGCN